jgi:hypothetical protein
MAVRQFNLEGRRRAGQTLVGNWLEDRTWQDDFSVLIPNAHGPDLMAQPGYERKKMITTYQKSYCAPAAQREKSFQKPAQGHRTRSFANSPV